MLYVYVCLFLFLNILIFSISKKMCSVGDDVFDNDSEKLMPTEEIKLSTTCNKCKTAVPCVVLRNKDSYCKACFLAGTTHKFKALLGKSRLVRPNDRVLVWHRVGHASTALLHLLRTGLDLSTPKKLRFDPMILFVDDQYHLTFNERRELLKVAGEEIRSFGFQAHFVSFAEFVSNTSNVETLIVCNDLQISESDPQKASSVVDKKCSKTSRNDIKLMLEKQLLVNIAKCLKCKFVFTPEISIDTASQLLTNISLGRGSHISIDTGFCDDRDDEVKVLRPLRLFDMKELAFYNKLNNLQPLYVRQPDVNPYSSVQDLMKKFVADLQVSFPATVTTILKTGDKLTLEKTGAQKCKICKGLLPRKNSSHTAEDSTNFSHLVSTETSDYSLSGQERYKSMLEKFDNKMYNNSELCYACSNIADYILDND